MPATLIGAHVPGRGGLGNSVRDAKALGCTALQVFTSSPRMWKASVVTKEKVLDFQAAVKECGIDSIVSHDSYLINLSDGDDEQRAKSMNGLKGELERSSAYGIKWVVSHIGACRGLDLHVAQQRAADAILQILDETPENVMLLMETTAGQGSSLNSKFEEIATLLALTKSPKRLGVCLDTCHIFAAGYDIRTLESYIKTFEHFDAIVGTDYIKVIHCNDSKKAFNSRVDRHANLGEGEIGHTAFQCLVLDPRFEQIPIVVETPVEDEGHERDVKNLWKWASQE